MFCTKCGAELPEGSKFCNKCGYKIGESPKKENKHIELLNGKEVDVLQLAINYKLYDSRPNSINACKWLKAQIGCSLSDAVSFVGEIRKNDSLMQLAKDVQTKIDNQFKQKSEEMTGLFCPKCHSKNIHIDKKGYSLTKGVVGTVVAGPLGLLFGKHGSNKLRYTCLNCNHQWEK